MSVLIVEDSPTYGAIIKNELESKGAVVSVVSTGADGLRILKREKKAKNLFKLILIDYFMADMDGLQLVQEIRRKKLTTSETLIFLMTAYGNIDNILRPNELGITACIKKPAKTAAMLKTLAAATPKGEKNQSRFDRSAKDRLNLLLVEDSDDIRLLVARLLRSTGYSIDTAQNGAQAVEKYKNNKYDLMLMDMQMPVMDGYEATKEIRKLEQQTSAKSIPIIAFTAHAFRDELQKCLDAGCTYFIPKPVRKAVLLKLLHEYAMGEGPDMSYQVERRNNIRIEKSEE